MPVVFLKKKPEAAPIAAQTTPAKGTATTAKKAPQGHTKARPIDGICFDPSKPSRLRVGHLLTIYGVSHSGLYNMLKRGDVPKPDGHFGTEKRPIPFWLTTSIDPGKGKGAQQ